MQKANVAECVGSCRYAIINAITLHGLLNILEGFYYSKLMVILLVYAFPHFLKINIDKIDTTENGVKEGDLTRTKLN